MAIPVLVIGQSGSGKSTSMRNCINNDAWSLIKVIEKPLPFKGKIPTGTTDNYETIKKWLTGGKAKSFVIDDAGYLITNYFMKNHSSKGAGNGVFQLYNVLADNFWGLIQFIVNDLPANKIVYIIMHEEKNDFGDIKPKTIGKLLDEKICLEGMFTIVLRCVIANNEHLFITQSDGGAVSKSPLGMFNTLEIYNDLKIVDKTIREYYEFESEEK
jgi:adenylate kinase family enzyme